MSITIHAVHVVEGFHGVVIDVPWVKSCHMQGLVLILECSLQLLDEVVALPCKILNKN